MRIRTVKPEFFLHEGLFDLEAETKLPIRLSYVGIWCASDREGRFKWDPRRLKAQILPYDEVDFSRVLDALTTRGFLVRYTSQGRDYGCVPTFKNHQFINAREKDSELPCPPEIPNNQSIDATSTRAPRVNDACPTRLSLPFPSCSLPKGEGLQGKGEGKPAPAPKESPLSLPIPESLKAEPFPKTWEAWVAYRMGFKKSRHPERMFAKQLEWLTEFGPAKAAAMLDRSIRNGWQGLFEITDERTHGTNQPNSKPNPRNVGTVGEKTGSHNAEVLNAAVARRQSAQAGMATQVAGAGCLAPKDSTGG